MFYSDDPLRDFDRRDAEEANYLAELPECDICHRPIQEDYFFDINGDIYCEDCLESHCKRYI